jgi:membrane fusion protein, multidrug efflux system
MNIRRMTARGRLGRRPATLLVGTALGACVALAGCKKPAVAAAAPAAGVPVYVKQAEARHVPLFVEAFGTIEAYRSVMLTPQVSGLLRAVEFTEGDMVKKGQVLYRIEPDTYRQTLDKAKAALAIQRAALKPAQDRLRRSQELNENKLLAPQDYEALQEAVTQAEANVASAEAGVAQAQLDLDRTTIAAPMDGVIGLNTVHPGMLLSAQQTALATVRQIDPIYVTFSVPGPDVPQVLQARQQGTPPVLVCSKDDFKSAPVFSGTLEVMDNSIDTRTDMMTLKGRLANPGRTLWPGQFVRVRLVLAELPDAVMIDSGAVMIGVNGSYVYVVKDGRTAAMQDVVLGEQKDDEVVVKSGLQAGAAVVIQGQLNLRNGTVVRVVPHQKPAKIETATK